MKIPSNWDVGPWKEVSLSEGIRVVETPNFDIFCQFANLGFGDFDCRYLWRGQRRAEWEITSTLERAGGRDVDKLWIFRNAVARSSSTEYDMSNKNPHAEEVQTKLWALGQHYGLATPLTDWTVYPYVALFFAFAEPEDGAAGFRAIFAIDWESVSSVNYHITQRDGMEPFKNKLENPPYSDEFKKYIEQNFGLRGDTAKLLEQSDIAQHMREAICTTQYERLKAKQLRIYRPESTENRRMNCQGGWHMRTPEGTSVEAWIRANWKRLNELRGFLPPDRLVPRIMTKVMIPNTERTAILRCLNKMNVNYLSLFPDLEGAAKYSNMAVKERRLGIGLREY
ncbi:MAG: FRG domain-containing protein [Verrucomicrobiia bacterium]